MVNHAKLRSRTLYSSVVVGIAALSGCAGVNVSPVKGPDQPGIRYWRPAPYLALQPVAQDGRSSCEAKLVMLPDKSEEYAIKVNAGLWGKADATPTLEDGWNLTSLSSKVDSGTPEVLTAAAGLITALDKAALFDGSAPQPPPQNCRGLFRLNYDEHGKLKNVTKFTLPVDPVVIGDSGSPPKQKKQGNN
jgi:hypothetical protein